MNEDGDQTERSGGTCVRENRIFENRHPLNQAQSIAGDGRPAKVIEDASYPHSRKQTREHVKDDKV